GTRPENLDDEIRGTFDAGRRLSVQTSWGEEEEIGLDDGVVEEEDVERGKEVGSSCLGGDELDAPRETEEGGLVDDGVRGRDVEVAVDELATGFIGQTSVVGPAIGTESRVWRERVGGEVVRSLGCHHKTHCNASREFFEG